MTLASHFRSYIFRSGVGAPKVTQCDGDYNHESRKNVLEWTLPVIDESNSSGTMEFSIPGHEDDFFPVTVSFVSKKSFCGVSVSLMLCFVQMARNNRFSDLLSFIADRWC